MGKKKIGIVFAVSVLVTLLLAYLTNRPDPLAMDLSVIGWLEENMSPQMLGWMEAVTILGSAEIIMLMTLLLAGCLAWRKYWVNSIFVLLVTGSGVIVNYVLKVIFRRERPEDEMEYIEVFGQQFELISYSFPSGHVMRITLLILLLIYIAFLLFKSKAGWFFAALLFILLFLIALSRVALGEHFPSDVLAAVSASVAWFCVCLSVIPYLRQFTRRRIN